MKLRYRTNNRGHSFNELIGQMEKLLEKSKSVKDYSEIETIEKRTNEIVLNMIHDMEKFIYRPEEVKRILDIHKKIVFKESKKKKFLFIKQYLAGN